MNKKLNGRAVAAGAVLVLAPLGALVAQARTHPKAPHPRVSAAQAQKTALHRFHGRIVGKTALENEDGQWQYSVNVKTGSTLREVMVSAATGKIASVEVTSPAEEATEAAQEAAGKG